VSFDVEHVAQIIVRIANIESRYDFCRFACGLSQCQLESKSRDNDGTVVFSLSGLRGK
jgi:hypothetical protein